MVIQRLPSAVVSSLRTDVTVSSTSQCVTELVLNSVDAGASAVAVRVDLKNFKIQVVDNGCGLSKSDLNVIGRRYMTSKCKSLQDLQKNLCHFGFRGEALSSITEVCGTLTIVSRCRDSDETNCKVFTQGVPHHAGKSRQQRQSCGTTITVSDFLYNRPVRRARIKAALDLEEIKTHMESIALINPHVSFSLRNDLNNELILQTHKAADIPAVFGTLFGDTIAKSLIAVKESNGPFTVEGYISNEAHLLKNLQFLYVNKRLLLKTKIHKLVNSILSRSGIIKSNNGPYVPISKEINHEVFLAFSPPKRDKHAVFVLNVTCPLSEYDITLDPKKTLVEFCDWDSLLTCFENLLRKFVEKTAGVTSDATLESNNQGKTLSVVDEINQLCREEALGLSEVRSTEGSVCTRNIPGAIHSLPVSRLQVNLSEIPSSNSLLSTATSNLSSIPDENDNSGVTNTMSSLVLTENPFKLSRCKVVHEDKFLKHPITVNTPASSIHLVKSDSKFKQPKPVNAVNKLLLKSFIRGTLLFDESSRKVPDTIPGKKDNFQKDTLISSPINALTNIKEIRRRKLLKNLSKFSYQVACEKPLLNNTVSPSNEVNSTSAGTSNTCQAVSQSNEPLLEATRENTDLSHMKESRANQTSFPEEKFLKFPNQERNIAPTISRSGVDTRCASLSEDNFSIIANASDVTDQNMHVGDSDYRKNSKKQMKRKSLTDIESVFANRGSEEPTDQNFHVWDSDYWKNLKKQMKRKSLTDMESVVANRGSEESTDQNFHVWDNDYWKHSKKHMKRKSLTDIESVVANRGSEEPTDQNFHVWDSDYWKNLKKQMKRKSLTDMESVVANRGSEESTDQNFHVWDNDYKKHSKKHMKRKSLTDIESVVANRGSEEPYNHSVSCGNSDSPSKVFNSIVSIENMLLSAYDIRQEHSSPQRCTPKFNSLTFDQKANEKLSYQSSLINAPGLSSVNLVSSSSHERDVLKDIIGALPDSAFTRSAEMSEVQPPEKKLVDYDSSPSSSQENFLNFESLSDVSFSPNKLRRKLMDQEDVIVKKACISSDELSPSVTKSLPVEGDCDKNLQSEDGACDSLPLFPIKLDTNKTGVDKSVLFVQRTLAVHNHFDKDTELVSSSTEEVLSEKKTHIDQNAQARLNESGLFSETSHQCQPQVDNFVNEMTIDSVMLPTCENSETTQRHSEDPDVDWAEKLDHCGKTFYVHNKSGITTYQQPSKDQQNTFKFNERLMFLPKGMSPIFLDKSTNELSVSPNNPLRKKNFRESTFTCKSDEEDLFAVKWGKEKLDKKKEIWPLVDQLLAEADAFSNKLSSESQVTNARTQELPQSAIKVYNVMLPCCFMKDIFNKLRVLGQLDNKFIVCVALVDIDKEVLVLFDQHAVHERIRVEKLTADYREHDGTAVWKSAPVDPNLPLKLSSIEVRMLSSFKEKMSRLGFLFSVTDSNTISVQKVPTCLLLRENREVTSRGVSVLRQHLESLIREQVDSLLNTRGVGTDHPTVIRNVISSEACKGAVKFGQPLTVGDCQAFLHNLSSCDLPFQCAHGRPALMPIVDLSRLKQRTNLSKPNLQKLRLVQSKNS